MASALPFTIALDLPDHTVVELHFEIVTVTPVLSLLLDAAPVTSRCIHLPHMVVERSTVVLLRAYLTKAIGLEQCALWLASRVAPTGACLEAALTLGGLVIAGSGLTILGLV